MTILWYAELLILGSLAFIALTISVLWAVSLFTTRAPFVPVPKRVVARIISTLNLRSDSVLYDLGSGDARILLSGFRANPSGRFIGIEKDIIPSVIAYFRWKLAGSPSNVTLLRKNFFSCDLSSATHVFLYLFPGVADDLLPKFCSELRPGTIVVACDFPFSDLDTQEIVRIPGFFPLNPGKTLFVYRF